MKCKIQDLTPMMTPMMKCKIQSPRLMFIVIPAMLLASLGLATILCGQDAVKLKAIHLRHIHIGHKQDELAR